MLLYFTGHRAIFYLLFLAAGNQWSTWNLIICHYTLHLTHCPHITFVALREIPRHFFSWVACVSLLLSNYDSHDPPISLINLRVLFISVALKSSRTEPWGHLWNLASFHACSTDSCLLMVAHSMPSSTQLHKFIKILFCLSSFLFIFYFWTKMQVPDMILLAKEIYMGGFKGI